MIDRIQCLALAALALVLAFAPAAGGGHVIFWEPWILPPVAAAAALAATSLNPAARALWLRKSDLFLLGWLVALLAAGRPEPLDPELCQRISLRMCFVLSATYLLGKGLAKRSDPARFFAVALFVVTTGVALLGLVESLFAVHPLYGPGGIENPFYERYRLQHRPVSTQWNPAALASFLLLAGLLSAAIMPPLRRSWRWVLYSGRALQVLCGLLTFSRGAAAGFVAAVVTCLALSGRSRRLLPLGLAVLLGVTVAGHLPPPMSRFGFERLTTQAGIVGELRLERMRVGFDILSTRPLTGTGLFQFGRHARLLAEQDDHPLRRGAHIPDQLYLGLLVETGGIGLFAFLAFVASLAARTWCAHRGPRGPSSPDDTLTPRTLAAAALVAALVNFVGYDALFWSTNLLLFGLVTGLLAGTLERRSGP